jgi:VanZ family protein
VVGIVYAALDEITQQFVPGRVADMLDFAADLIGLFTAIALYALARYFFRRSPQAGAG